MAAGSSSEIANYCDTVSFNALVYYQKHSRRVYVDLFNVSITQITRFLLFYMPGNFNNYVYLQLSTLLKKIYVFKRKYFGMN